MATSYPLWSDAPAAEDLLGFAEIAVPIVEAIGRDRLDPVAIGLFGPWGSGKSTLLEIVSRTLESDYITIRVQPWAYDPAIDAKAALIGDVLAAVRERVRTDGGLAEEVKTEIKDRLSKLVKRVRWSKAISLGARTALTLQLPSWDALSEVVSDPEGDAESPADMSLADFRDNFLEMMTKLSTVPRAVVLIDDLDRCLPEATIGILETIKLFLAVPKMAFVIAADEQAVVEAIRPRYRESADPSQMSKQYLEKIVQIPLRVPTLGLADTEAYITLLLLDHRLGSTTDVYREIVEFCRDRRRAGEQRLIEGLPTETLDPQAKADISLATRLAPVLYRDLRGNPRRIKRFLNNFWVRSSIARSRGIELDPPSLAKLMVLEELYDPSFSRVIEWALQGQLEERLAALETGTEDEALHKELEQDQDLGRWAKLEPNLRGRNLVPYVLLAASLSSRVTSSIGLGPELLSILEGLMSSSQGTRTEAQAKARGRTPSERKQLIEQLSAYLRRSPQRQRDLGESLVALTGDDASLADLVAAKLRELDRRRLEPTLVALLVGERAPAQFRDLVRTWSTSPDVPEATRQAAVRLLKPKQS